MSCPLAGRSRRLQLLAIVCPLVRPAHFLYPWGMLSSLGSAFFKWDNFFCDDAECTFYRYLCMRKWAAELNIHWFYARHGASSWLGVSGTSGACLVRASAASSAEVVDVVRFYSIWERQSLSLWAYRILRVLAPPLRQLTTYLLYQGLHHACFQRINILTTYLLYQSSDHACFSMDL